MTLDPSIDDPRSPGWAALLRRLLGELRALSPQGYVLALDVDALCASGVTSWRARTGAQAVPYGALTAPTNESSPSPRARVWRSVAAAVPHQVAVRVREIALGGPDGIAVLTFPADFGQPYNCD